MYIHISSADTNKCVMTMPKREFLNIFHQQDFVSIEIYFSKEKNNSYLC